MSLSLPRSIQQGHCFHLVSISPWPFYTSWSLLSLTLGAVLWFHGVDTIIVSFSFLFLFYCMHIWLRDVTCEGTFIGDHTKLVQKGFNIGVLLFIISEMFFFLSIFWGFFHSALSPSVELGSSWPPTGIAALNPFAIPFENTIVLLSSGSAVTMSHHSLIYGGRYNGLIALLVTIAIAIFFTSLQLVEYQDAPFTMSDGIFGTVFFFSTGFHGFHVLLGTVFLVVAAVRWVLYHLTAHHHFGYEIGILYWHFVDVVWIFLFGAVYIWGG